MSNKQDQFLRQTDRVVDRKADPLTEKLRQWFRDYAERRIREIMSGAVVKAAGDESELRRILMDFGIGQINSAGSRALSEAGGRGWVFPRQLLGQIADEKDNKVKLIIADTEKEIRAGITRAIADAEREGVRPTNNEIGRRLARTWLGPPGASESLLVPPDVDDASGLRGVYGPFDSPDRKVEFGFRRAQTIARTETHQVEQAAIEEGFRQAGIEKVRWRAFGNDGRSGDRKHYRMNQHKALTLADIKSSDRSRWFKLPDGTRMRRPGEGPAKHVINCRCTLVPVS